jgi:hypothetical protein
MTNLHQTFTYTSHEKAVLANKLQDGGPEMKQETSHGKAVLANKVQDGCFKWSQIV